MNKKTLKALEGSIEKWRKIVAKEGGDAGNQNCPLCDLFWDNDCEGCPVAEKTGEMHCEGSPHENWERHQKTKHYIPPDLDVGWIIECRYCKILANKELKFLEGLRP